MTDREKLVAIASDTLACLFQHWACKDCPLNDECGDSVPVHDMDLRFAAAKKLTMEARDDLP